MVSGKFTPFVAFVSYEKVLKINKKLRWKNRRINKKIRVYQQPYNSTYDSLHLLTEAEDDPKIGHHRLHLVMTMQLEQILEILNY